MDREVTISVQGRSAERVAWWLEQLRSIGLVPMGGGVREVALRPGHFLARTVPDQDPGDHSAS